MELTEFAAAQERLITRMAEEYCEAFTGNVLLRMDYAASDDCLRHSLRIAVEDGNPYARGLSPSDLRRKIEQLRTERIQKRLSGEN